MPISPRPSARPRQRRARAGVLQRAAREREVELVVEDGDVRGVSTPMPVVMSVHVVPSHWKPLWTPETP
jgi:hypothetical protein